MYGAAEVADALTLTAEGGHPGVLVWESDVAPLPKMLEHYCAQSAAHLVKHLLSPIDQ